VRGPAERVADAARGLLLADGALAETNAVFNVRVDGSGHVSEVHVLDASSDVKAWQDQPRALIRPAGILAPPRKGGPRPGGTNSHRQPFE
jgi:hypothetical protein